MGFLQRNPARTGRVENAAGPVSQLQAMQLFYGSA